MGTLAVTHLGTLTHLFQRDPVATSPIFEDDLTTNVNGWVSTSDCFFRSDGYHIAGGHVCFSRVPGTTASDANISVQVQQVSGSIADPYGLVFRSDDHGNYYFFGIDGNGKWLFEKVVATQATILIPFTPNAIIAKGLNSSNIIEVHALATHFELYVNGVLVGQLDDSTYSEGRVGLAGDDSIEVVYTNLRINHQH